jgi:integrase
MRVELFGLFWTDAKIGGGKTRRYYYAWRGGPRIKAKYGTPAFIAEFNEHIATRKTVPESTVFALVVLFKSSSEFTQLSAKTQKDYRRYLSLIEVEFGTMPTAALEDRGARGVFKAWRDQMSSNPRKADYAWTVLARVLSVAKDRGKITVNPCERGGRLYEGGDRLDKVWSEAQLGLMIEKAPARIVDALMLAIWTGQREGDLLRLRWKDYDGQYIRLMQRKTVRLGKVGKAKRVTIPVSPILKAWLDGMPRHGPTILTNTRGALWTEDGFRSSWHDAVIAAGINEDLTFHDLRGSAVVRLALSGSTVPMIATFTGHALKDVEHILDRHYLGRDVRLAESAMQLLAGMFSTGVCKVEGTDQARATSKTSQRPAERSGSDPLD